MKNNTLYDLNNILFQQLRSLTDESLAGEKLTEAIRRSTAVQGLSETIIENAALALKATLTVNNSLAEVQMPKMIEDSPQTNKQTALSAPKALNG